jgi:hypothetical protein
MAMAAAGLALVLAGCGSSGPPGVSTAPCPRIAILADGADLTRFRPGAGRDLTGMIVDAKLAGFDARCDFDRRDNRSIEVQVTPRFQAERGPAAEGRTVELPWLLVLSDPTDTEDLSRVNDVSRVTFPPNVNRITVAGRTATLVVPVAPGTRAQQYLVRLAFQVSQDELSHNRQRGVR